MEFKIAVLPGDGIGPEISAVGVDVMSAVCEKFGHQVNYAYALCGAHASTACVMLSRLLSTSSATLKEYTPKVFLMASTIWSR